MTNRSVLLSLAVSIAMIGSISVFSGCGQQQEGSAERAGKAVDQSAENAGESLNKAMEDTSNAMKEMGENVKEGTQEAMESAGKMLEGDKK